MPKQLVIVESPAKAKTIEKFLGSDYQVRSSFGHIRDLPSKGMSIDIEHGFKPEYVVSPDKTKVVNELKKAAKGATVWLASDEDREGEAIAWHLTEALGLDPKTTKRIVFHEITKPAILAAIEKPRTIDQHLVNAQQARRVLDRLVGYELSPVLWKKVRRGLSAGRVQSVAVRLIVERERKIAAHETQANWRVRVSFDTGEDQPLVAELPDRLPDEPAAKAFLEALIGAKFSVANLEGKPGTKSPGAPFTTSTLQQEASRRLGFSVKQTMTLAQRLYENGHITYMRTDSVNLSNIAVSAAARLIEERWGKEYVEVRKFKNKNKSAQEAHEAIRPTNFAKEVAGGDDGQKRLYRLIWSRAMASQMAPAKLDRTTLTIAISGRPETLTAKGEVMLFEGWLKVYDQTNEDTPLPPLKVGQELPMINAEAQELFSKAAARYTEASLVKQLEEMGIGRPSTYAPTISTIQDRGYVEKRDLEGEVRQAGLLKLEQGTIAATKVEERFGADRGKLLPTETGNIVTDFLVKYFADVVDYDFTANLEGKFDQVADGEKEWTAVLEEFYGPFHKSVEASADISRQDASGTRELGIDPESNKPVYARLGRYGPMVQIGDATDDEKPRFAPLPEGATLETVTLEAALTMFDLPRTVGKTEEGEEILANIGRYGPYVQIGKLFVSIKPEDPRTITLETARELIKAKQKAEAEKIVQEFPKEKISVLNGRYGPYVTDGKKNAKVPKEQDPAKLTVEQAKELLAQAPKKFPRRRATRG